MLEDRADLHLPQCESCPGLGQMALLLMVLVGHDGGMVTSYTTYDTGNWD